MTLKKQTTKVPRKRVSGSIADTPTDGKVTDISDTSAIAPAVTPVAEVITEAVPVAAVAPVIPATSPVETPKVTIDVSGASVPHTNNSPVTLSPNRPVSGGITMQNTPNQGQRTAYPNQQRTQGYQQNNSQRNYGNQANQNQQNQSRYPSNNQANQNNYRNSYVPTNSAADDAQYTGDVVAISGMLEVLQDYGVIRQKGKVDDNLPRDVYISHSQIKRFNLRMGDFIKGFARPPKEGERYLSLLRIDQVEGVEPEVARKRPQFTELTPVFPNEWLKLETAQEIMSTRLIDLIAPIGRGQRAMVVAQPKAGKTWLLKDIANGITTNYPDVTLLVALIGERPEEVTHFSRSVKGEVFASNFDERAEEQTRVAELCLERAKRFAEKGKDVVILMDSLTRLARAYNMVAPPSGRTLTGGFDPAALYPAKHFFGAARNFEEGGSLTIIATALVDTGSRMDDVIFEEFKGTGNMELKLDRTLAERRVFPSIDIKSSGTRHEEQLFDKETLDRVFRLRRMVDLLDSKDATELVMDRLRKSKTNKDFLENLHKGA